MAEAELGAVLRDPRRRLGPRLPPPRERDRPVGGGGAAVRPDLDAQRDGRDRRREDVEVGGQHLPALGGARPLRARGGGRLPDLRALPAAAGVRGRADGAGGGAGRAAAELLPRAPGEGEPGEVSPEQQRGGSVETSPGSRARGASARLSPTTSTRRGRWPRCSSWSGKRTGERSRGRPEAVLRRCSSCVGLELACRAGRGCEPTSEAEELLAEREEARAAKDFERADEIRDRAGRAGLGGARLGRGRALGAEGLDGRRARSSTGGGRSRRRSGGGGGCTGSGGRRRRRRRSWSGSAARPTTRASSPRSIPIPTPTRDGAAARRGRAARRARPGPGPAQPRRRLPLGRVRRRRRRGHPRAARGRGDRRHLQGLGGRGRAPRGRPRPQPRRLARPRRRQAGFWIWGADAEAEPAALGRRPQRPDGPRPRRRGQGHPAPRRRRPATASSPCRSGGKVDSLNVSAAAAALLFEAVRQRALTPESAAP